MKKEYQRPALEVLDVETETSMLNTSPDPESYSNPDFYSDKVTDKYD